MRGFTLLFVGSLLSRLAIGQPIILHGQPTSKHEINIRQQTWFYEDPASDTLQTFASVRHQHFVPLSESDLPKILGHNYHIKSTRIIWLRFQLVNTHPTDTVRLWYEQGTHTISTLYDSSGRFIAQTGIFRRKSDSWPENLPIRVLPQKSITYYVRLIDYIRVFSTDSDLLRTPLGYAERTVTEASRTKWLSIAMAMIVGCLLLMSLYTLFQYYLNRDRAYLYYALYAGAGFCWIVKFADGRLALGLAPAALPQLFHPAWISISYLVSFFYALFLSKLLNLRSEQPLLWRVVVLLMVVLLAQQAMAFIELVTGPWFYYNTYYLYSDLLGVFAGLILLVAIFRSRSPMKKYLLAGGISLFIIAISPLHGFILVTTLSDKAKEFINYPPFFMALGLVIELFCFALALAYRSRLVEEENASLHATYTQELEDKLAQRTKEIQAQSYLLEEQRIRQLELGFEQKLAETEMIALRAQMNPHFIFNCLNSIKLYATDNDTKKASEYLTKFSRLIRLVLENSRSERITLQNELDALQLYLDMEAMRFKNKLHYQIDVQASIDTEFVEIPPLLLQPYVENAIWHGLMQKLEGGNVAVRVEQLRDDYLQITITDDGIGRTKAAELKSKSATPKKSFGMNVTSERIALINKLYQTQTQVQIHDLTDSDGQPAGTEIVLEIPI
ncbi:histidine kinase [Spirosoma sp. BT702]|uniref:Histidine kinase n=1 Tax=Spirosoma profusum TaxID=2771354 RepID=A0A927AWN4_9BACT|nr:histidine kinase [Spirosoma profusum]MBD2705764.1 histidine kinase [Spirosoma profusum]